MVDFDWRIALCTSSTTSTRPGIAVTVQPMSSSSANNDRLASDRPAFRDRKVRLRAPRSTIHVAIDLPRPPTPPARR